MFLFTACDADKCLWNVTGLDKVCPLIAITTTVFKVLKPKYIDNVLSTN